ncbi:MAG: RNA pseudouridine synthase, partial [Candidatus Omnitrophica bacterium]|nr:RNA pseudouridine synthase [Candidatus Omnitrophota bacterium]
MSRHQLTVDEENANIRLDVYLTQILVDLPSRTFVQRVIEEGKVLVNGHLQN